MTPDFKIELGVKAADCITGLSGIVTGRAEYLTGCIQYCIMPKAEGGKPADGRWFDEHRLLAKNAEEVRRLQSGETIGDIRLQRKSSKVRREPGQRSGPQFTPEAR